MWPLALAGAGRGVDGHGEPARGGPRHHAIDRLVGVLLPESMLWGEHGGRQRLDRCLHRRDGYVRRAGQCLEG